MRRGRGKWRLMAIGSFAAHVEIEGRMDGGGLTPDGHRSVWNFSKTGERQQPPIPEHVPPEQNIGRQKYENVVSSPPSFYPVCVEAVIRYFVVSLARVRRVIPQGID